MNVFNNPKIPRLAREILASDFGKASMIVITWQLAMTLFGVLFDSSLSSIIQNPNRPDSIFSVLRHTFNWDSDWYNVVIQDAYKTNLPSSVFYPLFPLAVWVVSSLTLGVLSVIESAFIVNTVALMFAVFALVKISDYFVSKQYRWWIVALFLASPAAIFLHFFYTEAVFCAIGFWAYLFALKREWWKMGLALGLLTAVRLPAVLFIALCAFEYMRIYKWNIKRILNKQILWFAFAPLGFVLYGMYLYAIRGDFFAMLKGYSYTDDWSYHVFNPNIIETIGKTISGVYQAATGPVKLDPGLVVNNIFPLLALTILIASAIYCLVKMKDGIGIPLALFSGLAVIMFTINSNVVSVHRYALPCLIIYIALGHIASNHRHDFSVVIISLYASLVVQTYLFILFANGYFAG